MTREIPTDVPLSDADRAYLEMRDKFALIEQIDAAHGNDPEADAPADDYDTWKKDELVEECEGREPAIELTGSEKKADLRRLLREHDAAYPDDSEKE